jgi:2-keto-4-pentenoate hydratase/2-oxohepta-3-ene-1,7-dioic acid hydratase in catechol pathway
MKLVSFRGRDGEVRPGAVVGDDVVDLSAVAPSMLDLLQVGVDAARPAVGGPGPRIPMAEVTLTAPVARPPKFLAIGLNYALHVAESQTPKPEHQLWFNKQSTCVIGPGEAIEIPRASTMVDYEGELGFVIGQRCRHVPADRAAGVIAGYLVVNDVSVRDWQRRTPTMTVGKSFDTHGPTGPWIVTADEVPDPHDLRLRTWVSDDLRQDSNTGDMIFDCFQMVEHLSTAFTLEPGDIISTGTPSGVGMARIPPAWLVPGDTVRITIDGIGTLENPVVNEVSV